MTTSIKFNGKEVRNPILRGLAITAAVLVVVGFPFLLIGIWGLSLGLIAVGVGIAIPIALLTIPLHFILRALGRRGFYTYDERTLSWEVNSKVFAKREP